MKFSELPSWAKGVIAVVALGGIVGIGFAIRRAIKNAKEGREEKEQGKELGNDLDNLLNQGVAPTLSNSDAISLTNFIVTALSGWELSGTEAEVVTQILSKVQNQADWLKLQQTFGQKDIPNGTFGSTTYDLKSLLLDQLDSFDWSFTKYSTNLQQGLTAKGINW